MEPKILVLLLVLVGIFSLHRPREGEPASAKALPVSIKALPVSDPSPLGQVPPSAEPLLVGNDEWED